MRLRLIETAQEVHAVQQAFDEYLIRDIMPSCDSGEPLSQEDLAYFRSDAYQKEIARLCARDTDPMHRYCIEREGTPIGFAMCCTYHSEDGKCFVMEMCIYPPYRGKGYGTTAFHLLQSKEQAAYYELHTSSARARKFWEMLGFQENGYNGDGNVMMVLPPQDVCIRCEALQEEDISQLFTLLRGYKRAVEEPQMTERQEKALKKAVSDGAIRFFVAKYCTRVVGICSVSCIFSTYRCRTAGIFEDFYIEPAFRGKGIARQLTNYVQTACASDGIVSLWVGSSLCDVPMYQALGFSIPLGNLLTWNQQESTAVPPKKNSR